LILAKFPNHGYFYQLWIYTQTFRYSIKISHM